MLHPKVYVYVKLGISAPQLTEWYFLSQDLLKRHSPS